MITGIPKNKHGFTDYTYVPMVWAAPKLVGFEDDEQATKVCRAFSTGILGVSLLTDAKWGLIKVIPYKVHAALDLASGLAAVAVSLSPIAKEKKVRNTFLTMGIVGITVGILSLIGAKKSK